MKPVIIKNGAKYSGEKQTGRFLPAEWGGQRGRCRSWGDAARRHAAVVAGQGLCVTMNPTVRLLALSDTMRIRG